MSDTETSGKMRIEINSQGCELSDQQIEQMETDVHTLRKLVTDFPVAELQVTVVCHQRKDDFHVKTSLVLPNRTLFTGERDASMHPAFESCIRKLTKKIGDYKKQMRVRDRSSIRKPSEADG